MRQHQIKTLIQGLKEKGVEFGKGLSQEEFKHIQAQFQCTFPEDWKAFLQIALPVSDGFPHWRYAINSKQGAKLLQQCLNWPLEGMYFDLEHNAFWLEDWGEVPAQLAAKKAIAKQAVAQAPLLIPIYSHRYLPATPNTAGNPVFSVYQTDIIYYGNDLMDYLEHEFKLNLPASFPRASTLKQIEFWSDLVD